MSNLSRVELDLIERKKKSLKRYKKNINKITRLKEDVQKLDMRISSVKSPSYSNMPRGGTVITKEDLIAEKLEIEERITRLEVKSQVIKRNIIDEIDEADIDDKYATVLEDFFIKCKSISDIADERMYSDRYVYHLYSKGISLLAGVDTPGKKDEPL